MAPQGLVTVLNMYFASNFYTSKNGKTNIQTELMSETNTHVLKAGCALQFYTSPSATQKAAASSLYCMGQRKSVVGATQLALTVSSHLPQSFCIKKIFFQLIRIMFLIFQNVIDRGGISVSKERCLDQHGKQVLSLHLGDNV